MDASGQLKRTLIKLAIALNLGIGLTYVGLWLIAYLSELSWRADFTAFYTAAVMIVEGVGDQIYDFELQTAYQRSILEGRYLADGLMAFYYPPPVAILVVPLGYLSRRVAYAVWAVLQVVILFVLMIRLWHFAESQRWPKRSRWAMLSIVVALPATMLTFLLGAFSLLILLCLLEFVIALKNHKMKRAGLWLSLGMIKPQAMMFAGLTLLMSGGWSGIVVFSLVLVATFVLSSLLMGPACWVSFARAVLQAWGAIDSLGVSPSSMYNLKGVLSAATADSVPGLLNGISLGALLIAVLFVVALWILYRTRFHSDDMSVATTLLCGLVFGVHVNPQDALLAVVPGMLLWNGLFHRRSRENIVGGFLLLCPILILMAERVWPGGFPVGGLVMVVLLALAGFEVLSTSDLSPLGGSGSRRGGSFD